MSKKLCFSLADKIRERVSPRMLSSSLCLPLHGYCLCPDQKSVTCKKHLILPQADFIAENNISNIVNKYIWIFNVLSFFGKKNH